MMLSLPESLLLFALHDEHGTLRASAYLSLDPAMGGAVLGELLVRGNLRMRSDGDALWVSRTSDAPLLQTVIDLFDGSPDRTTIDRLLFTIDAAFPDLREAVSHSLIARGALRPDVIDREDLGDTATLRTHDASFETAMVKHVRAAVACGSSVPRRLGLLVALIHVCELWPAFDDPALASQGRALGEWVLARDPLIRAVRIAVQKAEGTFDM